MTTEVKLIPVKTLNEWFANLPLIYKIDLYNLHSEVIMKHLKPTIRQVKEGEK